jgi:diguanylate cyclase (GGDEF)-like protein
MQLDVLTLVAMGSFVAASAGAALFVAWWQNPKIRALGIWGFADLITALGILGLMLGSGLRQPVWAMLGSILLALAAGLMWMAARTFDGKPAPLALAAAGAACVAFGDSIEALRTTAGLLSLVIAAIYLLAAAMSFWLARRERLAARWPIIILTTVHGLILFIGAYTTFSGAAVRGQLPAVMSLFGLIHFESIIFTLGTAVFMLALVKERNEAASQRAARVDSLTGIPNRTAFMENAERVIEACRREGAPVSVIMFDLDWFKAINDTHGHAIGDTVLCKFCEMTAASVRASDVFGRIGGEEFAVVLPRSSIEAAWVRAERIRVAFAESCHLLGDRRVEATVSCGVAARANAELTLSDLLEASDAALYRAKAEGRNRVKRADQPGLAARTSTVIRVA